MTTTERTDKTRDFLTAAARSLYADPTLELEVDVVEAHGAVGCRVMLPDHLNPGLMVGKEAKMRFALQNCIAAAYAIEPDNVAISIEGADHRARQPDVEGKPQAAPVEAICRACVAMVGGSCSASESEEGVLAVVRVPDQVKNRVRPSLLRIVRAIGWAHGFPAMAHVSST